MSLISQERCGSGETLEGRYWRRQTREPVQFAAGIRTLADQDCQIFLELGPTPTLLSLGKRCMPENTGNTGTWLSSLQRDRDDWEDPFTGHGNSLRARRESGLARI